MSPSDYLELHQVHVSITPSPLLRPICLVTFLSNAAQESKSRQSGKNYLAEL